MLLNFTFFKSPCLVPQNEMIWLNFGEAWLTEAIKEKENLWKKARRADPPTMEKLELLA